MRSKDYMILNIIYKMLIYSQKKQLTYLITFKYRSF